MAQLSQQDPFFSTYEIHVAAGTKAKISAQVLPPLQAPIRNAEEEKQSGSITLSCGKFMMGVTVPEWSSIFMLRSLKAPESYFQAGFRVQSPWKIDGEIQKQTAYVFEFDPNRALSLVALYGTELANNSPDRKATQASVLGRSLGSYRKLTEMGIIDVGNMTDAVQKFDFSRRRVWKDSSQTGIDRAWYEDSYWEGPQIVMAGLCC